MKYYIATAFAALLIGTATTPSVAEDQPSANSSSHTMGDSGTLHRPAPLVAGFPIWAPERVRVPAVHQITAHLIQWATRANFPRRTP